MAKNTIMHIVMKKTLYYNNIPPDTLSGTRIYAPGNNARENEMRERLKKLWQEKYNY